MSGMSRIALPAAVAVGLGAFVAACGGSSEPSGSGSSKGGSINVAIVDNPQMKDIASLTQ